MRAAAEFLGEITHGNNSYEVSVLLIKQCRSTGLAGFLDRQHFCGNRNIFLDLLVDDLFDLLQLLSRRLLEMREVETGIIRAVVGTSLSNMAAEHLSQCCLQQMQAAVVRTSLLTCFIVIGTFYLIAEVQRSFDILDVMQRLLVRCFLHIGDIGVEQIIPDLSGICALAAGFCIEAGTGENDITLSFEFIYLHAIAEQADDLALAGTIRVAGKLRFFNEVHQILGLTMHGLQLAARISCPLLLGCHLFVEARFVYRIAGIFCNFSRQLFRIAVRIIETEYDFTRQVLRVCMFLQSFLQQRLAIGKRAVEGLFFVLHELLNQRNLLFDIAVVVLHGISSYLHELVHERAFNAELDAIAHGSAQHSAEHIASAFI